MKKVLIGLLGTIILLAGMALICYPFISNYLMSLNHNSEIDTQQTAVENIDKENIQKAFNDAETYNKSLLGTVILIDPFDPNFQPQSDLVYEQLLNINNDSIMGSIEIPKINVKMPIFHGTTQDVLLKGVGHLQNTSLPIGGKSTHSVLTGHTGVSNSALFTDIDKLVEGDVFFIRVLDRTLAYEVDQIKVVVPTDTTDLKIKDEEDYVTLVTCTPYGINSHRLLVRGTRIPYEEAELKAEEVEPVESTWMAEYKKALIIGGMVLTGIIVVFIIIRILLTKRKKKKQNSEVS